MPVYSCVVEDRFMNTGKNLALSVDGGGVGDSIDDPARAGGRGSMDDKGRDGPQYLE